MNRANFHQFKGSDWQTVAVRTTTIKADLYSLALSPIAISDVTVWSSLQRNFVELHLVLKGVDVEWKDGGWGGEGALEDSDAHTHVHTHTYLPISGTKAPWDELLALKAVTILKMDVTALKKTVQVSHHYVYYLHQWLNWNVSKSENNNAIFLRHWK